MRLPSTLAIGLALGSIAGDARADAIEPEPSCPGGQVGVSDHSGPRCEAEPPTNCPEGWRGVRGGTCILHTCDGDAQCGGKSCVEQPTCVEKRLRRFKYGALDAAPQSRTQGNVPAAFGPPMQPIPIDPPEEYWEPINFCGPGSCGGKDQKCEPRKVCVSRGAAAQPATVGPDGNLRPPAKGCAACAVGGEGDATLGLLASGVVLMGWSWRRARKGAGRGPCAR